MVCLSVVVPTRVRRSVLRVARCIAGVAIALLLLPGTVARAGGDPGNVSRVEVVPDGACPTPNSAAWDERVRALEAPEAVARHAWVGTLERWAVREGEWVEASGELEGEAARLPVLEESTPRAVLCAFGLCAALAVEESALAQTVVREVEIPMPGDARLTLRPGARERDPLLTMDLPIPSHALGRVFAAGAESDEPSSRAFVEDTTLHATAEDAVAGQYPLATLHADAPLEGVQVTQEAGRLSDRDGACRIRVESARFSATGWVRCAYLRLGDGPTFGGREGPRVGWGCADCTLMWLREGTLLYDAPGGAPVARTYRSAAVKHLARDACGWTRVAWPTPVGEAEAWTAPAR